MAPQDQSYAGEPTRLEIGDHNKIASSSRSTVGPSRERRIDARSASTCWSWPTHISPIDCTIGDHVILANAAHFSGGHVIVEDWAQVGALCPVHYFVRIGTHAFVGGGTTLRRTFLPSRRRRPSAIPTRSGMNSVGLQRRGFSKERIHKIHHAYKVLLASRLNTSQALQKLKSESDLGEDVAL